MKVSIFRNFSMNSEEKNDSPLDVLADRNNLAIITVDENERILTASNDNSMCRMLSGSAEFSSNCAEFCGRVFQWTNETGGKVEYQCYAGLNCMAVRAKNKRSVAIIGRVFLKAEDYRNATIRAAAGDWRQFPAEKFFGNTLFGGSPDAIKETAEAVHSLELEVLNPETESSEIEDQKTDILNSEAEVESPNDVEEMNSESASERTPAVEIAEIPRPKIQNPKLQEWRSLFGSFLKSDYERACHLVADFVAQIYAVPNLAWLEREENRLEKIFAKGGMDDDEVRLSISANDAYLLEAVRTKTPLELREKQGADAAAEAKTAKTIWLFPFVVGGETQSALVVGDDVNDEQKRRITRFCRKIAPQMEILRLRGKLSKRSSIERAIEKFNESLKTMDAEDLWSQLIAASAELMRAERSSLLIFNEQSQDFTAKAATGIRAEFIRGKNIRLGRRVAKNVLSEGKPVVVKDVRKIGLQAAPDDWLYKSDSFISYPIEIAGRKIGVLNLTDKADGKSFDAADLKLLDSIMPSLAVMIDRADLKNLAGEFKQLSVTDSLTGLRNRRYLEERLTEEIKRSNRHGFPMSFLMIDVDEFKSYNDAFGHTEGDKALQIVGACLRETLRGADVAARYGGEEFSILLPQTSSTEAEVIAERIRERVEKQCFPNRQVTISIGIASGSLSLNSTGDLISAADKALYEAKRAGRNNVRIYESLNTNFVAGTRRKESKS